MCSVNGPDASSGADDEFDASCSEAASPVIRSGFESDDAQILATDQSILTYGVRPNQSESHSASTTSFQAPLSIAGDKDQRLFRESNVEDRNVDSNDESERRDAPGNTESLSKDYESSGQSTSPLFHATAGMTNTSTTMITGNAQVKESGVRRKR